MADNMWERLVAMFGGADKVPDYLRDAYGLREEAEERREQAQADHEAAEEAEFDRKRALRKPPRNVRLRRVGTYGMEVHWDPPETADELPPTGYIVSGDSDSSRLLPPETRSQFLRIYRPGNVIGVETDYSEYQITKLGEHHNFTAQVR